MAPPTRLNPFRVSPERPLNGCEADTPIKTRFLNALAKEGPSANLSAISREYEIHDSTGRKWKKQWLEDLGPEAVRSTRKRSKVLGKKSQISNATCQYLVSKDNPVRKRPLDTQIAYHKLSIGRRQLTRMLRKHTKSGKMYKCAFVKKIISQKNKKERCQRNEWSRPNLSDSLVPGHMTIADLFHHNPHKREEYGEENMYKPLFGFWDHIEYTDEAHLDPTSPCHGMVLREEGHRYDPENIEEVPPLKGVRLHIAGWISWWGKAKRLEFYNHEEDELGIQPSCSPKPRFRSTTETKEEYAERVKVWDAEKLHKVDKKIQGNAMTQNYYVDRLLPVYIEAIESMREIDEQPNSPTNLQLPDKRRKNVHVQVPQIKLAGSTAAATSGKLKPAGAAGAALTSHLDELVRTAGLRRKSALGIADLLDSYVAGIQHKEERAITKIYVSFIAIQLRTAFFASSDAILPI